MSRRSIPFILAVVLVLAVATFAVACGSGNSSSTSNATAAPSTESSVGASSTTVVSTGTTGATPSGQPIKIGTSLPLTGARSVPGEAAKQGYEVWADMVNKNGGLLGRPVELVIKDDASDQNIVVADYNALISQDKADLLLGTYSSILILPASAIAEKNNMLFISPTGASPEIYSRGFKKVFMSQQALSPDLAKVWANYIANLPVAERPKTAAYPTIDDPFSVPEVDGVEAILSAAGIKTVYKTTYPAETTDFDSIVNAMKGAKPDLVMHGAQFEDGVAMVRAMLKADFTPTWLFQTTAPAQGDQYANAIGVENTEGIFDAKSHEVTAPTPGNAEFVKRFHEMFGADTTLPEDTADAYAAGQVLAAAVTAVGSLDQDKLAEYLHANKVETILGTLSWDEAGRPQGEYMIGQWQSGKFQVVLPAIAATTDKIIQGWKPGTK
ncbi:MAG TPA: amino acid ABC transporter substrate-binding protein [Thermoleophilia bacterium]